MSKLKVKIQVAYRKGWIVMRIGCYDIPELSEGYYVVDTTGYLDEIIQGPFTKRQAVNLAYHYALGR